MRVDGLGANPPRPLRYRRWGRRNWQGIPHGAEQCSGGRQLGRQRGVQCRLLLHQCRVRKLQRSHLRGELMKHVRHREPIADDGIGNQRSSNLDRLIWLSLCNRVVNIKNTCQNSDSPFVCCGANVVEILWTWIFSRWPSLPKSWS